MTFHQASYIVMVKSIFYVCVYWVTENQELAEWLWEVDDWLPTGELFLNVHVNKYRAFQNWNFCGFHL